MKLITNEHRATMLANNQLYEDDPAFDPIPVVKVFNPLGSATWLLCSLDRGDPDIVFGLCDFGFGSPEVGSVRISEMEETVLPLGLRLERDLYFKPSKTLGEYAKEARFTGTSVREVHMHRTFWASQPAALVSNRDVDALIEALADLEHRATSRQPTTSLCRWNESGSNAMSFWPQDGGTAQRQSTEYAAV